MTVQVLYLQWYRGETHEYNGTDYTYTGLSDVTVTEGEDETVYNFKLREGVTFSDGEPLTADDLIFTYYVLSDTDYDGNAASYRTSHPFFILGTGHMPYMLFRDYHL